MMRQAAQGPDRRCQTVLVTALRGGDAVGQRLSGRPSVRHRPGPLPEIQHEEECKEVDEEASAGHRGVSAEDLAVPAGYLGRVGIGQLLVIAVLRDALKETGPEVLPAFEVPTQRIQQVDRARRQPKAITFCQA